MRTRGEDEECGGCGERMPLMIDNGDDDLISLNVVEWTVLGCSGVVPR